MMPPNPSWSDIDDIKNPLYQLFNDMPEEYPGFSFWRKHDPFACACLKGDEFDAFVKEGLINSAYVPIAQKDHQAVVLQSRDVNYGPVKKTQLDYMREVLAATPTLIRALSDFKLNAGDTDLSDLWALIRIGLKKLIIEQELTPIQVDAFMQSALPLFFKKFFDEDRAYTFKEVEKVFVKGNTELAFQYSNTFCLSVLDEIEDVSHVKAEGNLQHLASMICRYAESKKSTNQNLEERVSGYCSFLEKLAKNLLAAGYDYKDVRDFIANQAKFLGFNQRDCQQLSVLMIIGDYVESGEGSIGEAQDLVFNHYQTLDQAKSLIGDYDAHPSLIKRLATVMAKKQSLDDIKSFARKLKGIKGISEGWEQRCWRSTQEICYYDFIREILFYYAENNQWQKLNELKSCGDVGDGDLDEITLAAVKGGHAKLAEVYMYTCGSALNIMDVAKKCAVGFARQGNFFHVRRFLQIALEHNERWCKSQPDESRYVKLPREHGRGKKWDTIYAWFKWRDFRFRRPVIEAWFESGKGSFEEGQKLIDMLSKNGHARYNKEKRGPVARAYQEALKAAVKQGRFNVVACWLETGRLVR